ncbi:Vacuolar protein sorting-associated protein vta1 [Phlyctochytrium bullatum]|nr:Vacuolar protein sorting-associated protein vta1 [Phlyctochytrium bullatum]
MVGNPAQFSILFRKMSMSIPSPFAGHPQNDAWGRNLEILSALFRTDKSLSEGSLHTKDGDRVSGSDMGDDRFARFLEAVRKGVNSKAAMAVAVDIIRYGLPMKCLEAVLVSISKGDLLKAQEPLVAYYCYFYAAKLAIDKNPKDKQSQQYLASLLDSLEQHKSNYTGDEAFGNDLVASAQIESFAMRIFDRADRDERMGKFSKYVVVRDLAKAFNAAAIFFDLLKTFGPLDEQISEKQRYAKYKAVQVLKAAKTGPSVEQQQGSQSPATSPMPTVPSPQLSPHTANAATSQAPPPIPPKVLNPTPSSATFPSFATPSPNVIETQLASAPAAVAVDPLNIEAAMKAARFAISALQYEDIATAKLNLRKALSHLGE